MKTLLYNSRVILPERVINGYVMIENETIFAVEEGKAPMDAAFDQSIDLGGAYLSPGFVELHSHGAGGADFMDGTDDCFAVACQTHLHHGTTTLLPTVLAASPQEILRSIDGFKTAKKELQGKSLYLHGLHMEGPYLNVEQKGAINEKFIRNPDPKEYEQFLEYADGCIARWTVAAELDGAMPFIRRLNQLGVLPSIGHSNAEYAQVKEAFACGATHVTHLYSAMSTITRRGGFRYPGVLESAFCIHDMNVEIIADGCHIPPELLRFVWEVKGAAHTALTCDSMRCAGQEVKESWLGNQESGIPVIIEDDVAKLTDRSAFAGSIATDDRLVRTMVQKAGVPFVDAVRMMTLTPAEIIGLGKQKGSIEVGKDADLICFDDHINVQGAMVGGCIQFGME